MNSVTNDITFDAESFNTVPALSSTRFGLLRESSDNYLEKLKHLFLIPVRYQVRHICGGCVPTRSTTMANKIATGASYIAVYDTVEPNLYCDNVDSSLYYRFSFVCM